MTTQIGKHLFTIVWPHQTGRLWCLIRNFKGIIDLDHSKTPKLRFLVVDPPRPPCLYTQGARYKKNPSLSLVSKFVCAYQLSKLSFEAFLKSISSFKTNYLVHRLLWRQLPTQIAARYRCRLPIKNLTSRYNSKLSFLFGSGSSQMSINMSKWGLN